MKIDSEFGRSRGRSDFDLAMQIALFFLCLATSALALPWSASHLSVASYNDQTLAVFETPQGLNYSLSPFNTTGQIRPVGRYPVVRVANGTWHLIYVYNRSVNILRATEPDGPWNLVFGTGALDEEVALTPYSSGKWGAVWKNAMGVLTVGFSTNDGLSWSTGSYSYGRPNSSLASAYTNFTHPSMAAGGQYGCILALSINDTQVLSQIYDGVVLLNVSGSGRPQVVSSSDTVAFLTGSGDLYISRDRGGNWSAPIKLEPGFLITDREGEWLVVTNSSIHRSTDDGLTWNEESTSLSRAEQVHGSTDQLFVLSNGTVSRLVLSLNVTAPLVLDSSLVMAGTLIVASQLEVRGDLILMENSTLNLTQFMTTVEVLGNFTAAGRLLIPTEGDGTIVLIKFNSSTGNFTEISGAECSTVQLAQSSLSVTYGACTKSPVPLWLIIVIVTVTTVAVTAGVVLFVCFRSKIAPYHDRTHYVFDKKEPNVQ